MGSKLIHSVEKPQYLALMALVSTAYALLLLHLDQLFFFAPYVVISIPTESIGFFLLDIFLPIVTVVVIVASIRQTVEVRARPNKAAKSSLLAMAAGLAAGACPCNYLVPLLTVAGAMGMTLGAIGTMLNEFELPLKLGSLVFLIVVAFSIERTLDTCKVH
jgi:hypothetical protein